MSNEEVNPLTVGDVETLLGCLSSVLDNASEDEVSGIVQAFSSGSRTMDDPETAGQVGFMAARILTRYAQGPFFDVLASVRNESPAEFREQPAHVAVDTLAAVIRDERNRGFFYSLAGLFKQRTQRSNG